MASSRTSRSPSTSQHTLLGLLSLKSWTAYELTQQMQRAIRWVWPRSEASIYSDLKRLVPAGLATTVEEDVGDRTRARYDITGDGRKEALRWLRETEPAGPQVQVETVLRVFLADLAEPDDLRRSLDVTRRKVAEQMYDVLPVLERYAEGGGDFPERAHLNGLFMHYLAGFFDHLLGWCDDVEAELDTWPDTVGVGMNERTRRMIDEAIEIHRRGIEQYLTDPTDQPEEQ